MEEVTRLVSEGKLPADARGRDVCESVINEMVPYTGGHGKDGHRAALRALADIRLLFQQAALPPSRQRPRLRLLANISAGLTLFAVAFLGAAALFPTSPYFSWIYGVKATALATIAGVIVGIPFATYVGLALDLHQQDSR